MAADRTPPAASPSQRYRTIVADPAWPFTYNGWGWKSGYYQKRRGLGYETMTVEDICALPVSDLAEPDAHLYLWIPDPLLVQGVAAQVAAAWGFPVGRLLIWEKPNFGMGTFPRSQHEAVMVCRRGTNVPFAIRDVGSVIRWKQLYRKGKVNSAKPDAFMDLVEQASPGPYLELFARSKRIGWDVWGDEVDSDVELSA